MKKLLIITSIIIFLDSTLALILYNLSFLKILAIFPRAIALNFSLIAFLSLKSFLKNLKNIDIFALTLLFFSLLVGIYNCAFVSQSSYKINFLLIDFFTPLIFYIIFLSSKYSDIFYSYLMKLYPFLLITSAFGVLTSKVFSIFATSKQGYLLPLNLPFSLTVSKLFLNNSFNLTYFFNIICLSIVFLFAFISGKRSMLLSFFLIFIFLIIKYILKNLKFPFKIKKTSILVYTFIIIFGFSLFFSFEQILNNTKLGFLIRFLNENEIDFSNTKQLHLVTSQRSTEIISLLPNFKNIFDWIFGIGSGFYYKLDTFSNEFGIIEFKRNAHFSPLSLTYKYGIIFTFIFYYRIINLAIKFYKSLETKIKNNELLFNYSLIILVVLTIIQSFFSFNLFVEPLLPITLSVMNFKISNIKNNLYSQKD